MEQLLLELNLVLIAEIAIGVLIGLIAFAILSMFALGAAGRL